MTQTEERLLKDFLLVAQRIQDISEGKEDDELIRDYYDSKGPGEYTGD